MAHTPEDERSFSDLMRISFFHGAGYKAYDKVSEIDLGRWEEFSGSDDYHEASIRFAAAPELLEALKELLHRIDERCGGKAEGNTALVVACDGARIAIAKAEGST